MTYIVKAQYAPKLDEKREKRIHAALDRCNVKQAVFSLPAAIDGDADAVPFQSRFSELDWMANEDGTETELEIYVGADPLRAARLASELRACGMVVGVEARAE
jgi:hypothetical protein